MINWRDCRELDTVNELIKLFGDVLGLSMSGADSWVVVLCSEAALGCCESLCLLQEGSLSTAPFVCPRDPGSPGLCCALIS